MGLLRFLRFSAVMAALCAAAPGVVRCARAEDGAAKRGAAVFAGHGCVFCHGPQLMGTDRAPKILDVRRRLNAAQIAHQIRDGGKSMPPFGEQLTAEEIDALVAFLRSRHPEKLLPPAPAPSATP